MIFFFEKALVEFTTKAYDVPKVFLLPSVYISHLISFLFKISFNSILTVFGSNTSFFFRKGCGQKFLAKFYILEMVERRDWIHFIFQCHRTFRQSSNENLRAY